jgi:hypothetical protein
MSTNFQILAYQPLRATLVTTRYLTPDLERSRVWIESNENGSSRNDHMHVRRRVVVDIKHDPKGRPRDRHRRHEYDNNLTCWVCQENTQNWGQTEGTIEAQFHSDLNGTDSDETAYGRRETWIKRGVLGLPADESDEALDTYTFPPLAPSGLRAMVPSAICCSRRRRVSRPTTRFGRTCARARHGTSCPATSRSPYSARSHVTS